MMKIVHIAAEFLPEVPKKLTKKEKLHEYAILAIANHSALIRERVKDIFKPEWDEVKALEKELEILNTTI
jgi:hypothetical protein